MENLTIAGDTSIQFVFYYSSCNKKWRSENSKSGIDFDYLDILTHLCP